jgi:DNA-binding transcriptional MerR regulator
MGVYITTEQAANELNVSPQTIRNWIDWGLLKAVRVQKNPSSQRPGRIFVDKDSIEELLASGKL